MDGALTHGEQASVAVEALVRLLIQKGVIKPEEQTAIWDQVYDEFQERKFDAQRNS